ncbi:hypothetical protein KR009_011478 [Drosophila setifemur]|nr:hypothetical protein KR009_011478 [Drosophila setifemur]
MISKYAEKSMGNGLLSSRDSVKRLDIAKTLLGWRPPSRDSRYWWLYYIWTLFVILSVFIYVPYALIMTGIKDLRNFTITDLFTFLQAPVNCNAAILKTIIFHFMKKRYSEVQKIMDQMDNRSSGIEERLLIHNRASICHLVTTIYQGVYFGFLTMAVMGAMATGKTAFCLYNPLIDSDEGLLNFCKANLIETFTIGGMVMANMIIDVYPVVCVIILRTHINLLKLRIENLRSDLEKSDDQHYSELVECVKDYQLIIEYANLIRPVISCTVSVQLLSTGVLLGLSAASLLFFDTMVERVVSGYYSFAILFQTFPFSYVCEQLIGDCHDLSITLFHSKWIGAERRYRTTLKNFMHNIHPPILFTACGIFQICLNTNIKVMAKFAFSVVAIVQGMNLVDKLNTNTG